MALWPNPVEAVLTPICSYAQYMQKRGTKSPWRFNVQGFFLGFNSLGFLSLGFFMYPLKRTALQPMKGSQDGSVL